MILSTIKKITINLKHTTFVKYLRIYVINKLPEERKPQSLLPNFFNYSRPRVHVKQQQPITNVFIFFHSLQKLKASR